MIKVNVSREELKSHGACEQGMELFDAIVGDAEFFEVEWSELHAVWLAVHALHVNWLISKKIVPIPHLVRANLAGADLAGANLADARLAGARLAGARLTGARLVRADLAGADLAGARRSSGDAPIDGWKVVYGLLQRSERSA